MSRRWTLLLVVEALALSLMRLPADVRFDWFAFFDGGAELTIHALMARGLRPTIDFGYIYGLLPLAAGEAWYRLMGRSPAAFASACVVTNLITAWGMVRILAALKVGPPGLAWVVVAMPIGLISSASPSLTHAMERAILTHSLAELAYGRRSRALVMASICAFVKPSMAFLLGLAIVASDHAIARPQGLRSRMRLVMPALAATAALGAGLAARFGPRVLLNSLLPTAGIAVYRANRFGFFRGVGRDFWWPERPRLADYVGSESGIWIAASLVLCLAAIRQFSPSRRRASGGGGIPIEAQFVAICALLHVAFIVGFFGNRWSWVYYFNILTAGVAAVSTRSRAGRVAVSLLAIGALPASFISVRGPIEAWTGRIRSSVTFDLWASPAVIDEWRTVLELTRGRPTVLLATTDGAALLQSGFDRPEVAFLVRGHFLQSEIARKRAQLDQAEAVVVANPAPGDIWFDDWPEFAPILGAFRRVWSCPRLRVYHRGPAFRSLTGPRMGRYDAIRNLNVTLTRARAGGPRAVPNRRRSGRAGSSNDETRASDPDPRPARPPADGHPPSRGE